MVHVKIVWAMAVCMITTMVIAIQFLPKKTQFLYREQEEEQTCAYSSVNLSIYAEGNENTRKRCDILSPNLVGRTSVQEGMSEAEVEATVTNVLPGGSWWPQDCESTWRLAVIVPYRNREVMVGPFLNHMHPFLQRQLLNYTIFIVEQSRDMEFNRAKLLNIGYVLSQDFGPYDCYAFHDIDCVPEDDRNLYNCADQPRHLGVGMEKFTYKIPYDTFYGCACLMTGWQMEKVNGWSNRYFGWGGEDDNMWRRIKAEKMKVWRVSDHLATYATLKHEQATLNPRRMNILQSSERDYKVDGLNSLQFTLLNSTHRKLYTKFQVKL
ncbi:beta-1,4-galactosyltransferase 4-like [Penaeus indicus]|uniref:beta-1,4-galactosyltransferase 4-like n=1 Tax=Penaeus indicus TaxID=29960 RepID=UPI00300DA533